MDGERERETEREPIIQVIYLYQVKGQEPIRRLTVIGNNAHFCHQLR